MTPETNFSWVGVDISKTSLQVQSADHAFRVANDETGIASLIERLQQWPKPFVVFEATGNYEQALRLALHREGIALCLLSPSRVRAFAISEGLKAKSDPIDARMLLRFAQEKKPAPQSAPTDLQIDLAALLGRRGQLTEELTREKLRRQNSPAIVHDSIDAMILFIEKQIVAIESRLRALIAQDAPTREKDRHLQSVSGVGEVTSWTVLAFLPEITKVERNAVVALAGVAPFIRQSGDTEKRRSIYGGRAKVRRCLSMAALSASRCNPVIKPYVEGLMERGKPFKCAIVAAMRKLLLHLRAVLKKCKTSLA